MLPLTPTLSLKGRGDDRERAVHVRLGKSADEPSLRRSSYGCAGESAHSKNSAVHARTCHKPQWALSSAPMLDIKLIREKPDFVRERLATRGSGDEARIAEIAALDEHRRKLVAEGDNLKAERNKVSKEIGALKSKGQDASTQMSAMKQVGERIGAIDAEVAGIVAKLHDILLMLPNLPHESVAVGKDSADNPEIRKWGESPKFAFPVKAHCHSLFLSECSSDLNVVLPGGGAAYSLCNHVCSFAVQ